MALMDFINKFRKQAEQPAPQVGGEGAAAQIASLLKAKTGKGGATGTPAPATAIAAQNEANAANAALQQQALAGQAQAAQIGQAAQNVEQGLAAGQDKLQQQERMFQVGQTAQATGAREQLAGQAGMAREQMSAQQVMKTDQINASYQNNLAKMAAERGMTEANIWESFRQSSADLEYRKDVAELEQAAHVQSMANKSYVMQLQTIGAQNRLQDNLEFQKEATRLTLGNKVDQLVTQLNWKDLFNADEREFAVQMGQMDIDTAMKVLSAEIEQANTTAIASGAIKGAGSYAANYEKPKPPSGGDNVGDGSGGGFGEDGYENI